jgi:hypothetical protein
MDEVVLTNLYVANLICKIYDVKFTRDIFNFMNIIHLPSIYLRKHDANLSTASWGITKRGP